MLELRLRTFTDNKWFRYQLHQDYLINEVEAYIEDQTRQNQPVRLMTQAQSIMEFLPTDAAVVQLVCL